MRLSRSTPGPRTHFPGASGLQRVQDSRSPRPAASRLVASVQKKHCLSTLVRPTHIISLPCVQWGKRGEYFSGKSLMGLCPKLARIPEHPWIALEAGKSHVSRDFKILFVVKIFTEHLFNSRGNFWSIDVLEEPSTLSAVRKTYPKYYLIARI